MEARREGSTVEHGDSSSKLSPLLRENRRDAGAKEATGAADAAAVTADFGDNTGGVKRGCIVVRRDSRRERTAADRGDRSRGLTPPWPVTRRERGMGDKSNKLTTLMPVMRRERGKVLAPLGEITGVIRMPFWEAPVCLLERAAWDRGDSSRGLTAAVRIEGRCDRVAQDNLGEMSEGVKRPETLREAAAAERGESSSGLSPPCSEGRLECG